MLCSQDSLFTLNKLREEVDLEKTRANREKPDQEKNLEICIRAKNNSWIIAKITQGRELYMVLEKANETLLYASDAVEKFSDRCCSWFMFLLSCFSKYINELSCFCFLHCHTL